MNYFELYQIPIGFKIDAKEVKKKFYELSKQYHPDFYINQSAEQQQLALELATLNNKAYQTFSNPEKLVQYVLTLKNVMQEGENFTLPQAFLMEMMEVNEMLMDMAEDDAKRIEINQLVLTKENTVYNEMNALFEEFDSANQRNDSEILNKIKILFYKLKYINRLKEQLKY